MVSHKVRVEIKLAPHQRLLIDDGGADLAWCHVGWELNIDTRAWRCGPEVCLRGEPKGGLNGHPEECSRFFVLSASSKSAEARP